jgi:periplasmic mercuric ion binding protein
MKTLRILSIITLFLAVANCSFAQKVRTETFNVSGECGMCKKKIEKAAKEAGATEANWNTQTKVLKVTYNVSATSVANIQQKIAGVGYDTPGYKATDEAYNALDGCCQYERTGQAKDCCDAKCEMKDGKCEMSACKDADCCKDGKCTKKQPKKAENQHDHTLFRYSGEGLRAAKPALA